MSEGFLVDEVAMYDTNVECENLAETKSAKFFYAGLYIARP